MAVPKNASFMKQTNRKTIINIIYKNYLSRAEIARKTGLTRAAITQIVDDLIQKKIVVEAGHKKKESGRSSVVLKLNDDQLYCIGISIRNDRCNIGISTISGFVISSKSIDFSELLNWESGFSMIVNELKALIDRFVTSQNVLGIGVAIPGPVDSAGGKILNPPKLDIWHNVEIVSELKKIFPYNIFLERDAIASTLAEKNSTKRTLFTDYIQIDVSTHGVSCGIVLNNKLYNGQKGFAGEFGHQSIDFNGKKCRCGNTGCIECYASIDEVIGNAKLIDPEIETWKDLVDKSLINDDLKNIIEEEAHFLGLGVIGVVNLLELNGVILSGDIVYKPEQLINHLSTFVNNRTLTREICKIKIVAADQNYNESFISGAIIVSEQFLNGDIVKF